MTLDEVKQELIQIGHPAISRSLYDLGILKEIKLKDKTVIVTFAFPFPDIPIADMLINSVAQAVKKMNYEYEYAITTMNQDEKLDFMRMEAQAWKGNQF